MAKEFTFILDGNAYAAAPVKLERKKIYGWSSLVATDRDGHICTAAYISPEDSLLIPAGAAKMATVDEDGLIVKKSDLVAFDVDGKALASLFNEGKQKKAVAFIVVDAAPVFTRMTQFINGL